MKVKRLFGLAAVAALFGMQKVAAQYYHPVTVTGFSHDVIANGVGSASTSTTASVDAVDYAYVSKDFQATATSPAMTYGLPVTGQFMGVVTSTPGMTYQLAGYSGSNALKLNTTGDSGTLTFATATAAFNLYFLATGGSGSGTVSAVVNFSDGTSQTFTSLSVGDWYDQANFAIQGIGRIKITTNALEDGGGINPRIYQIPLAISAANQSKTVQSILFSKTAGTGYVNIFGVSADRYTTCLAPSAVTASAVTVNSATLNWTAPATVPTSYDIYYTSSTVAPNASTTPTIAGIAGATLTSNLTSGINPMTKYHVWIRSKCGTTNGEWAYGTNFTTPCSVFSVPYTENFDTTTIGSTTNNNAPMCWSYLEGSGFAGYGYVINSNSNSPTNSYYLYNSSANSGNQMLVSPQTTALSDGTKRVRFFAKGSAGYTLQVGTLTNPSDPTTFVSFNTTTITGNYAQYTVNIPSGGGNYLAFRHNLGGTYRGIYLDDIMVQEIPSCVEPTAVTSSNIAANSATIGWTAPATAPAIGYEVYYSTSNVAPTSTTVLDNTNSTSSTTVSAPLNTLAPSTTYYVWVRSNCSTTNKSEWSANSTTFTTPCVPIATLPWTENFDSMTSIGSGVVPNCWAQAPGNSNNFTSAQASSNTYNDPKSAPYYMTIYYPYNSAAYFWTPQFAMTAGVSYEFSFYWVGDGLTGWQNEVLVNNAQSPTGATSLTTFITPTQTATGGSNSTNYTKVTVTYVPTTTGNYSFAIKAFNTTSAPYYMGFDDFSVTQSVLATAETSVKKNQINAYPNPFTDVLNISDIKNVKSISVMDVTGRLVKNIEKPSSVLHLGELKQGVYLVVLNMNDGSQNTMKVIKK